jgi:hypothetical protein
MDEDNFPIGTEGRFTYFSSEFDGVIAGYSPMYGCLIKVHRDTGHRQEDNLHNGNCGGTGESGLQMETNDYWYIGRGVADKVKSVVCMTKPYDPTQGNEEDDV